MAVSQRPGLQASGCAEGIWNGILKNKQGHTCFRELDVYRALVQVCACVVTALSNDYLFTLVHRITDAWHYWASHVAQFNAQIMTRDAAPPGYEMLWAVGIDACVVRSVETCCVLLITLCLFQL